MATDPLWINADAGAPEYSAVELRRNLSGLLYKGVSDPLGARAGVDPFNGLASPVVTLSGSTIEVDDRTLVLYPGLSTTDGPYIGHLLEDTHTLDPADGASTRIDIVIARVYDDDHDASGRRELVTEYITGTPGGGQPATPTGALLLSVITVPAGGSPAPTAEYVAPWTVASGGVLPVRDSGEYPPSGRYDGMTLWDRELSALMARSGAAWRPIALADVPMIRMFVASDASLTSGVETSFGSMTVDYSYGGPLADGLWDSDFHTSVRIIPRDGIYDIWGCCRISGHGSGVRQAVVRKNVTSSDPTTGTNIASSPLPATADGSTVASVHTRQPFVAGDNIQIGVVQNSGSTLTRQAGSDRSWVEIGWVRPL